MHKKSDFIEQINRSSGGGLTLSLRDHEITEFYHFLKKKFNFDDNSGQLRTFYMFFVIFVHFYM